MSRKQITGEEFVDRFLRGVRNFAEIELPDNTDISESISEMNEKYLEEIDKKNMYGENNRLIIYKSKLTGIIAPSWNLWRSELCACDFSYANLSSADISYANLRNSTFKNANLENAHFRDSVLPSMNFENANLENADFYNAYADYSLFINSNLKSTSFFDTGLRQAYFENVDLEETELPSKHKLRGAKFRNVRNIFGLDLQ